MKVSVFYYVFEFSCSYHDFSVLSIFVKLLRAVWLLCPCSGHMPVWISVYSNDVCNKAPPLSSLSVHAPISPVAES